MLLQKYQTRLLSDKENTLTFEFAQKEGKTDWGLTETVFEEFVEQPILLGLERGRPIIRMSNAPILNNLVAVAVKKLKGNNRIEFTIQGSIFENRIVGEDKLDKTTSFIQINEKEYLLLNNLTANRVGTVMALWYIVDWLNGMNVEVNYEDYIPSCATCTMKVENLNKYMRLFDLRVRTLIDRSEGCICHQKEFETGDGCNKYYIRNTYPDLGEVGDVIKDLL